MSKKKQFLLETIYLLKENADAFPAHVQQKMNHTLEILQSTSDVELEDKYNMVVTEPAYQQEMQEDHPIYLVQDLYTDVESMIKSNQTGGTDDNLVRAVNRLKGFLNESDPYAP